MIIHSIESSNFLKYENLALKNLPSAGVIAVGGQNESGKTTIGETLCFALFGRTFTLDQSDPKKLICWGCSRCSVSVLFTVDDSGDIYRVDRYLDVEGTYGAKLSREDDGALLGKGIDSVDHQLQQKIGFGYDEFVESFYLAQRELTTPQPHSQTIKVMAGIAPLAAIQTELDQKIIEETEELEASSTDLDEASQQIEALAIDTTWMPELTHSHTQLVDSIDAKERTLDQLKTNSHAYISAIDELGKKWSTYNYVRWLGYLVGAGTFVFGLLWLIISKLHNSGISRALAGWLESASGGLHLHQPAALTKIAATLAGLTLVCLITMLVQKIRMRPDRLQADAYTDTLETLHDDSTVPSYSERINTELKNLDEEELPASIDTVELKKRCRQYKADESEVTAATQSLSEYYRKLLNLLGSHKLQHDFAMRDEQARLDMFSEIETVQASLNEKVKEQQRSLAVRKKANDLIDSTSLHLSHQFNQSILQLASKALPNFTRDRYKHLKIDENLDVRVFSNAKGDFMDFDEISSGTQRQVMLSLRLAMSQELINAIECGAQFLFLDEPFAFFDQQRIRDTIKALPEFSQDIQQIWLVAQEFPQGTDTELEIDCLTDNVELSTHSDD